jgi:DNA-binding LacI/PurR family transcriptional regulator
VAFSVWTILREAGLRVPQDVSLAGFDRLSHISYGFPFSLTSVRRDREQLGQTAFRLWWSRCMAGGVPGATHQHLLLPTGLVPGDSCAEAPKGVSVGEAGFGRRSDSRRAMELASV